MSLEQLNEDSTWLAKLAFHGFVQSRMQPRVAPRFSRFQHARLAGGVAGRTKFTAQLEAGAPEVNGAGGPVVFVGPLLAHHNPHVGLAAISERAPHECSTNSFLESAFPPYSAFQVHAAA